MVLETNEKHLKKVTLRKFKILRPSAIKKLLKLKPDAVKERILKIAEKTLGENYTKFAKFLERADHEIKYRNQSNNAHLEKKLIRIRRKLKYSLLITNDRLHEWGIVTEKNCSFYRKFPEDRPLVDCMRKPGTAVGESEENNGTKMESNTKLTRQKDRRGA